MGSRTGAISRNVRPPALAASVYGVIALFCVIYAYLTLRSDIVLHGGNALNAKFFVAHVSLILPEVIVWVIAARGAIRLKRYARSVIDSADGKAFDYIANALLLLVLYSIVISIASTIKLLFVHTADSRAAAAITSHLPVLFVLASSIYLFIGSYKLNQIASHGSDNLRSRMVLVSLTIFLVLVTMYIRYFYSVAGGVVDDDGLSHFGLSASTLLFTYVLPHIIVWLLGLLACMNLARYAVRVQGSIYKFLLRDLFRGTLIVYACTYIVQVLYVTNISTKQLNPKMLLVFGVIMALIIGYLLIYRGTRKLERMEA
jgi:hypothetical protein